MSVKSVKSVKRGGPRQVARVLKCAYQRGMATLMTGSAEGSVYKSIVKDALRLPWGWSVGGAANTRFFSTRIDTDGGRLVLTKFLLKGFPLTAGPSTSLRFGRDDKVCGGVDII
jgi:hypothetical protein